MSEEKVYHKNIGGIFQGEEKFIEVVAKTDYDALQRDLASARAERDSNYSKLKYLMGAICDAGGSVSQPHDVVHHANQILALGQQLSTARAAVVELAEIIIAYYSTTPHCIDYQRAVALKREIDHA